MAEGVTVHMTFDFLADPWFWCLAVFAGCTYLDRWLNREKVRLREEKIALLTQHLAAVDKALANRLECWKILQNMEPALAEETWKAITGIVMARQWPKDKRPEGGN